MNRGPGGGGTPEWNPGGLSEGLDGRMQKVRRRGDDSGCLRCVEVVGVFVRVAVKPLRTLAKRVRKKMITLCVGAGLYESMCGDSLL